MWPILKVTRLIKILGSKAGYFLSNGWEWPETIFSHSVTLYKNYSTWKPLNLWARVDEVLKNVESPWLLAFLTYMVKDPTQQWFAEMWVHAWTCIVSHQIFLYNLSHIFICVCLCVSVYECACTHARAYFSIAMWDKFSSLQAKSNSWDSYYWMLKPHHE